MMRIGLIGMGFMGGVHVSAIEQIEGASLTAVSSRSRPTAHSPARGNLPHTTTGIPASAVPWYSDWRDLLKDPNVDAVDICLPTYLHEEVAIRALSQGKHVLCEKPMALTPVACDAILEEADKSGRIFMVGQVLRFLFPYRYAASFIAATPPASVKSCILQRKTGYPQWSEWLSIEKYSGGAIVDLLIHDIDQALTWFGPPCFVTAASMGAIDTMLGILHYSNGHKIKIEGGWYPPGLPFSAGFEIVRTDGALTFEEGRLHLIDANSKQLIEVPESAGYLEQMTYFVACCRENTPPQRCLPAESARAVKLALLLKASREQNGKELACEL